MINGWRLMGFLGIAGVGSLATAAEPALNLPTPRKFPPEKALREISAKILPTQGRLPENSARDWDATLSPEELFSSASGRPWLMSVVEWDAPATRSLPLYFEEPNSERMGYVVRCDCDATTNHDTLQSLVSAGKFYGRVPLLPYLMLVDPPCEPRYTLGVDHSGSPNCYRKHALPLVIPTGIEPSDCR